ncbi:MAG: hypothetical protein ACO1QB_07705 [Verrucomicrobiales bacterium]
MISHACSAIADATSYEMSKVSNLETLGSKVEILLATQLGTKSVEMHKKLDFLLAAMEISQ